MSGRSSARKGADGEREVMRLLQERGYSIERGGTQSFGQQPDLSGLDNIHMEIKRTETSKIWEWMEQSVRDAQRFGDGWPTVIFRRSRSNWLICMQLSDWLDLYERAQGQQHISGLVRVFELRQFFCKPKEVRGFCDRSFHFCGIHFDFLRDF